MGAITHGTLKQKRTSFGAKDVDRLSSGMIVDWQLLFLDDSEGLEGAAQIQRVRLRTCLSRIKDWGYIVLGFDAALIFEFDH